MKGITCMRRAQLCQYPYGKRVGYMVKTQGALEHYAHNNKDRYPDNQKDGLGSLQQLYPEYLGMELAGMSGNIQALQAKLKRGESLDATCSSWVYLRGFYNTNDDRIAMLYERQIGIGTDGEAFEGRIVGFVGGGIGWIRSSDWVNFINQQKQLLVRKEHLIEVTRLGADLPGRFNDERRTEIHQFGPEGVKMNSKGQPKNASGENK
jgi:hypothetical protein